MAEEQNPDQKPAQSAAPGEKEPAAAEHTAPKAPGPKAPAPAPKAPALMAATPWEADLVAQLRQHFGDQIAECSTYAGQNFLIAKPDAAVSIIEFLKLESDFDYLVDITAVDYPQRPERFELVYVLYSFPRNERMRIKTRFADGYKPATAVNVHLVANWLEREVFDMFGIEFAGHPDMRRILLPEDWEGHPLRKDKAITAMDNDWVERNLGIESGQ